MKEPFETFSVSNAEIVLASSFQELNKLDIRRLFLRVVVNNPLVLLECFRISHLLAVCASENVGELRIVVLRVRKDNPSKDHPAAIATESRYRFRRNE